MRNTLAAIIVLALSFGVASAATVVYDTEESFLAAIGSDPFLLEDFDDFTYGSFTGPSLDLGPENGFSCVLSAGAGGLWSGDGNMSTGSAGDLIAVDFQLSPDSVLFVGGEFFASDIDGFYIPGQVTLLLSDGTLEIYDPVDPEVFRGFVSDQPILSMTIDALDDDVNRWSTMDHFYVGGAATGDGGGSDVPATSTWGVILLIALFMTVSLFYLRKRGSQNA